MLAHSREASNVPIGLEPLLQVRIGEVYQPDKRNRHGGGRGKLLRPGHLCHPVLGDELVPDQP